MMKRPTHRRVGMKTHVRGYTLEDSWVDYSDGQGVTYTTRSTEPIPLGIVKLERDAAVATSGPSELYVVVHVQARNAWGNITRFDIWRWGTQASPYRLEDAQALYEELTRSTP